MMPRACFVHVVRHPLDVALSTFAQPFEGRGLHWAWQLRSIAGAIQRVHAVVALWEQAMPGAILTVGICADSGGVGVGWGGWVCVVVDDTILCNT